MKKLKNHQTTTQAAIVAGAAALMALTPNTHAQTSVDNLLNKLEQKGILTPNEADELKAENATNSVADFNKAMNSRFPMSDWITSYKLYGDFRGRFDDVSTEIPAFGGHDNNIRLRYRLRAGLIVNMKDNLQVGFRLGTGDAPSAGNPTGGNPLSNNTTLQGNASKKYIYVDTAYGKWTPINNETWMVAGTIGKMDQPFQESYMLFDPDYTPEGAALQATYNINDRNSLAFNSAAFVLDQVNTRGPFLYGGQAIWNASWTPKLASALGVAAYDIVDKANLKTTYDTNLGNTLTAGSYAYDFNPIAVSGSLTYTLDSFPLYPGAFPVKLAGEYLDNPGAGSNNKGWWGGVTFGKSGKRGAWDISYRYQRLEADAWWDQIVDDDNIAVTPTTPAVVPETGTAVGGTNIKGHLVKFNYSIFDSLTFSFTCYINDLINNPVPGVKTGAVHAMADLMWKF
ncbi:MAG TPA: putative porin [Candidatus Limnocylindrales bacterium]|nr:putative porin [Candidatus Limnocylindrales bacterium]